MGQGQVLAEAGAALGGDIHDISWEMLYNDISHIYIYIFVYDAINDTYAGDVIV